MLWIILAMGLVLDLFFGIRLFYKIIMYLVDKIWYEADYYAYNQMNDDYIIVHIGVDFNPEILRIFITTSSICILIALLILLLIHFQKYKETTIKTKTLCAINSESAIHYAISLEFESIYSFYLMDDEASHREEVNARDVYIYEEDNCIPHVEEHKKYIRYKNPNIMFVLLFSRKKLLDHYYEITVPKGSILKTF